MPNRTTRSTSLAVPHEQRRLPSDGRAAVAIDHEARVLMAAAGMGDGGENEPQSRSVETAHGFAEPHRGCFVGADRSGDAEKPLFSAGECAEMFGDRGEVDPVGMVGGFDPRTFD